MIPGGSRTTSWQTQVRILLYTSLLTLHGPRTAPGKQRIYLGNEVVTLYHHPDIPGLSNAEKAPAEMLFAIRGGLIELIAIHSDSITPRHRR